MADLSGYSLGRYHIVEQLGEGGMATVYKAYDTSLERDVAVKVIRVGQFGQDVIDGILKRFEREAKALARLNHSNIVHVNDFGKHNGIPYLVMDYLPGGTLKGRMRLPMTWQAAARLLLPVANALDYAHENKVIHRDVKPANILMTAKGQPMLSDFGIAKILETEAGQTLTGTGVGIGTPEYMSPEQGLGKPVDGRADIYSLGIIFYELVTGRKPYAADTPMAVVFKHITDPLPDPRKFMPDLPENVTHVLFKALAKDPDDRYLYAEAFGAALEKLLNVSQTDAPEELSHTVIAPIISPVDTPTMDVPANYYGATPAIPAPAPVSIPPRVSLEKPEHKPSGLLWLGVGLVVAVLVIALLGWGMFSGTAPVSPTRTATQTAAPTASLTALPTNTLAPTNTPADTSKPMPTNTPEPVNTNTRKRELDGMLMLYIPEGPFMMGNDSVDDEKPAQKVTLGAYWIDQTEVTNSMYAICVSQGKCQQPQQSSSSTRSKYYNNPQYTDYPVIFVKWNQAEAYCIWAGAKLPSEAQWEKAARGTDGKEYPWGAGINKSYANINGSDTNRVGGLISGISPYGAYDMAGNVWEWASSLYQPYPYNSLDGREDLTSVSSRVLRGGSWNDVEFAARSAKRGGAAPFDSFNDVGFRCARSQ